MTWQYKYDPDEDATMIYWNDEQQATINGYLNRWRNGYPASQEAREAISEAIQDAGTSERIRMQFDFNYGFEQR